MRPISDIELQVMKTTVDLLNAQVQSLTKHQETVLEALRAQHNMSKAIENALGKSNTLLNRQAHDLMFLSTYIYWLSHVLQEFEKVMPAGSVDLILNSVEETMDPRVFSFYKLYDGLRQMNEPGTV
jgi:hypothetical protein